VDRREGKEAFAMKTATGSRFTSSGVFIALLLVVFSASGLMAGMLTRQVSGLAWSGGSSGALPSAAQTATAAAANVTPAAPGAFALRIALAPNPARAGQTLQITVTAFNPTSSLAAPGVLCTPLQTASAPQFGVWPGPQTTDASGQARWSVALASQTTPGSYQVYVKGEGAAFHGSWYGTLVVAA
jgi:hypothetical protein